MRLVHYKKETTNVDAVLELKKVKSISFVPQKDIPLEFKKTSVREGTDSSNTYTFPIIGISNSTRSYINWNESDDSFSWEVLDEMDFMNVDLAKDYIDEGWKITKCTIKDIGNKVTYDEMKEYVSSND